MTRVQKNITLITTGFATVGFAVWFYFERTFEPAIGFVLGVGGFLGYLQFDKKFKKRRLKGSVTFDYSDNNGSYVIGKGDLEFETKFSKASNQSIHLYNDPAIISGIAIAKEFYNFKEIHNAAKYDFSSRARTIQKHQIATLRNQYGNYAAIKIIDIKDNSRGDSIDEVTFIYMINPDQRSNFT